MFGGNNTLVTDSGTGSLAFIANPNLSDAINGGSSATVFGASHSNIVYSGSAGVSYLIAGTGNETLNGSGASGALELFGNGSQTSLVGGSGADTLIAGTGAATMTGGSGADNLFLFSNGMAGGSATITDFGSAAGNMVGLFGYGANAVQTALASATATTDGSGSNVVLSDNTTITFSNLTVAQLQQHSGQFFSS